MNYINYFLFEKISPKILHTVIKISLLKEINIENINKILNIDNAEEILEMIKKMGSFFKENYMGIYNFDEVSQFYLQEKAKNEFEETELKEFYLKCAKYYEKERKNLIYASEYYILSGEYQKATELIVQSNINHLGLINYNEIGKYIKKIPLNIIEKNPSLCINLAHIYRINDMETQAKYWFEKFSELIKKYDKKTSQYQKFEQMQIYYKICQPEANDISLSECLKLISRRKGEKNYLKNITVTGNQPSILNGGKDLSNWARHYKVLYKTLNPIVLKVFEEKQMGAAEIAIAEVLYYGNKIEEAEKYLNKGIKLCKNIDNLFCAYSLMDKIEKLKKSGKEPLVDFKNKLKKEKAYHLNKNYHSRIIEKAVSENNLKECEQWNEYNCIDIINGFNVLERYTYFVKVKVLITLEKYAEALIILERLNTFINKYNRNIYKIEYNILKSICLYQTNNKEQAFKSINQALQLAQKNNYIRFFSDEGPIIYSILEENTTINQAKIKAKFVEIIKVEAQKYAKIYPNKYKKSNIDLTSKELEIVKLIKQGYSNEEICQILYISKATVKTHINHIYSKLNVVNRVQLINKIEKNIIFDSNRKINL